MLGGWVFGGGGGICGGNIKTPPPYKSYLQNKKVLRKMLESPYSDGPGQSIDEQQQVE